jgi:hypothetical protein
VLALGGCGEETSSGNVEPAAVREASGHAASQARTIRRTVRRAKREATDGSARRTCRFITPEGQVRAIQAYSARYQKPLTSCSQMVRFARKVEADYLSDARRATIYRIKVQDTSATVTLEGPRQKLPGDKRGYGGRVGLKLLKVGDLWRVDDTDFVPYGTGE